MGDRAVRVVCILGARRRPFQNGAAVRPPPLFLLYVLTGFALPMKMPPPPPPTRARALPHPTPRIENDTGCRSMTSLQH
jgi:hypothetical protein